MLPRRNNDQEPLDLSQKYFGLLGFLNASSVGCAVAAAYAGNWSLTTVFAAFAVVGGVTLERYANRDRERLKAHFNGFATGAVLNLAIAVGWPQLSPDDLDMQTRASIKQEILKEQQRQREYEEQLFNALRNHMAEKGIRFKSGLNPN